MPDEGYKVELADKPFSATRVAIWAMGIIVLIDVLGIIVLAMQRKEIPPTLGDVAKVGLGALAGAVSMRQA